MSVPFRARILAKYRTLDRSRLCRGQSKTPSSTAEPLARSWRPRGKPYWRALDHELHVGYRKSAQFGRWVARRYFGNQQYLTETIGTADDHADADGVAVLDWWQAQVKAREWRAAAERAAAGTEEPAAPVTVADVVREYLDWTEKHRQADHSARVALHGQAHILPALGKLKVAKLTTERLRKWHEGLAEQPARLRTRPGEKQRHREQNGDPDAVRARRATANRNLTVLKAALNHAWQGGEITGSDEAWRKRKAVPGRRRRPGAISPDRRMRPPAERLRARFSLAGSRRAGDRRALQRAVPRRRQRLQSGLGVAAGAGEQGR